MTRHLTFMPLAHLGAGATWQATVTLMSLGLIVVFLLTVAGKIPLRNGSDLVLPLAILAILSAIAPSVAATMSDQVGWAFPVGTVLLIALVVTTFTSLGLTPRSPLTITTVVIAVVAALALHAPLTDAWHPTPTPTPTPPAAMSAVTSTLHIRGGHRPGAMDGVEARTVSEHDQSTSPSAAVMPGTGNQRSASKSALGVADRRGA